VGSAYFFKSSNSPSTISFLLISGCFGEYRISADGLLDDHESSNLTTARTMSAITIISISSFTPTKGDRFENRLEIRYIFNPATEHYVAAIQRLKIIYLPDRILYLIHKAE
jgi:hypothetical protein